MTDDALIEAMARAMLPDNRVVGPYLHAQVKAALAVARPIIEERLWKRFQEMAEEKNERIHLLEAALRNVHAEVAAAIMGNENE